MTDPIYSPLLHSLPALSHGFFTREGGASTGLYASLNTAYASSDRQENIQHNRNYITGALGAEHLCSLSQIHSNEVVIVTEPWSCPDDMPKGDGMVTNVNLIALGILTADCVPVLFADAKNGVIGAAHAGWKGAHYGILENTITAMVGMGAELEHIIAAIGPSIHQKSYEVSAEFRDIIMENNTYYDNFFVMSENKGHFMFNLPGYVAYRLTEASIIQTDMLAYDTLSNPEQFFSYRRSTLAGEADYGRQLSAIMLRK